MAFDLPLQHPGDRGTDGLPEAHNGVADRS